jgi:hypothetical protein
MSKRSKRRRRESERHYRVYAIELSDPCPRRRSDLPWVYVGYTSKSPWQRFQVHRAGRRHASPVVTRYGVRLRPDLYGHLIAFRVEADAIRAERKLRQDLLDKGHSVRGGKPGLFDAHVPEDNPKRPRRTRTRRASFPGPSRTIIVEPITIPDKEAEPVEVPAEEPEREPAEVPA